MQKVNLAEKLAQFSDQWKPKVVGELNGQQVKLVKFQGPFVWHHHDHEEGEFLIVPRGVEHRPVAEEEGHVLLFEPASTLNTGNVQNERTVGHYLRADSGASAGKSVYPFAPVGEYRSDIGAVSASGQSFLNRSTRSGLLMNGRPKEIRSGCPWAIAFSAVSLG
jgi:mannose-6-phosphate isomerase-like protein (cupin superfamily)